MPTIGRLALTTAPSRKDRYASRPMVWLVGLFSFQTVYAVQSLLPQWMRDFDASAAEVGGTVGATVLGIALLAPFIGMLSDAVGRKPMIVGALLALALPTALIASAQSLQTITWLRFAEGVCIPGISVVMMAYVGEEFPQERIGRMMAAFVSGSVTGGFLGRLVPGHISEWWDWRTAFVVLGVANVLGALLVLWLLPPSRNFRPHADVRSAFATLGKHLRNHALLGACGVGFCVLLATVANFTFINVLLGHAPFSLSPGALANVFAVFLIGVVVTPLAGRLIQRQGYRRSLRLAMLVGIAGMLLTLIPHLPVIIVGLTLASCGTFFAQASSISFIAANVREGRSLASGMYNMAYYLGGAVGAWGGGVAFVLGGWPATVAMVMCSQLAALAVAWFGWRETPVSEPVEELLAPGAD